MKYRVATGSVILTTLALLFSLTTSEPKRYAGALTGSQLTALKADIQADGTLNAQPNNSDGHEFIRLAYNVTASPNYWVWRTSVTKTEFVSSVSVDGTTFNWVGNGFITRSAGEQAAWTELFSNGSVNPSLANVRQAFNDILSGTGNAAANRTHMLAIGRRTATRVENLFAINTPGSGAGRGTTADPDTMVIEGSLTVSDVETARNLP